MNKLISQYANGFIKSEADINSLYIEDFIMQITQNCYIPRKDIQYRILNFNFFHNHKMNDEIDVYLNILDRAFSLYTLSNNCFEHPYQFIISEVYEKLRN